MYSVNWDDIPETENLPNNFRRAVAGKEMGVNRIRWVHPTTLPSHVHEDAEKALMVVEGAINFTVGDDELVLRAGAVTIVPRGVAHSGSSIEGEALFIEVFAPLRVENLLGFIGRPVMPKAGA